MSNSTEGNNPFDNLTDESSVPDTPMSHLMFYFYCVDKLTNLSENNAQLKRVIDYKNDNLTPNELEVLLVFCTQLDPDSLEGKCIIKNDELCDDKNFKVLRIEDLPEGTVKNEEFFIAGQRVKCDRVIVYKKSWIKKHFFEPWMKVVVPDKQSEKYKSVDEDDNRILLPAASPKENNNNGGGGGKVVIVQGPKVRVEEGDKVRITDGSKVAISNENNNNNNNILPPGPPQLNKEEITVKPTSPSMDEIKPLSIIPNNNNNNNNREKPPLRIKSTPVNPINSNITPLPVNEVKPISKHYTIPSNNVIKPLVPVYPRPTTHTTKVNINSDDVHIVINPPPQPPAQSQQQQNKQQNKQQKHHINRKKAVYKYVWYGIVETSKNITCCIDCVRNLFTFAILLVFIIFLGIKFANYLDYSSTLLQKYAIIAMFCSLSLSLEIMELCINCCTLKSLNYMGYRLYSIFIAVYYALISVYTQNADSSLPFYCFICMAIIHLFGTCWRVEKED